jgi:TatD DNase family protein
MFIDIHCHLDVLKDQDKIIDKCKKEEVGIILTNGGRRKSNRDCLKLSEKYLEVKVALGLYPLDAKKMTQKTIDSEIDFIKKNAKNIIAIGEVGMDFKEEDNDEKKEEQVITLKKFIHLSKDLDFPIIIHSRKAELECIELLEKEKAKKVLMHCFSGKLSLVKRIVDNGWSLSIPANVTFSEHFQKVVEMTPIEQLFCETDSPYLHPKKEFPNEPSNVIFSYKKISEIKNIKLSEVEKQIEKNYISLFIK